jgi:hypothetical protein
MHCDSERLENGKYYWLRVSNTDGNNYYECIGALLHTHPQSALYCQLENLYCHDLALVQNKGAKYVEAEAEVGVQMVCAFDLVGGLCPLALIQ